MKQKIEFTNPRHGRICSDALAAGGKIEFVARSSGSGESVMAWVKKGKKGFITRSISKVTQEPFEIGQLETTLGEWLTYTCTKWDEKAKEEVVVPLKDANRTSRGLIGFYIRVTTPAE